MAKQTYGLRMMKRTSNSGNARASKLTPERRSEIARKANAVRNARRGLSKKTIAKALASLAKMIPSKT